MNPYGSTRVDGEGPTPCDLMFVGEGPGADEDKWGRPFVGKSGRELNRYIWHSIARTRTSVYVTNLVKYRVPNDGDPTPEDIERDRPELEREIASVRPDVIVAVGRHSTRRWLPDADMETVHGIIHLVGGTVVLPVIHPAAGLHSTEFQGAIAWDFEQLGKLVRGEEVQWAAEDEHPRPLYRESKSTFHDDVAAVDTEGSITNPWCFSYSSKPGRAEVVRKPRYPRTFKHVIFHNSLHDIGVCRAMDVWYESFDDTMIASYLLCVEPQGLKALARRHTGMLMSSYDEIVGEAGRRLALEWLKLANSTMRGKETGGITTGIRSKSRSKSGKGNVGTKQSGRMEASAGAAGKGISGSSHSNTKEAAGRRTIGRSEAMRKRSS